MATFQEVNFNYYKYLKPLNRKGTVLGIKKKDKDDVSGLINYYCFYASLNYALNDTHYLNMSFLQMELNSLEPIMHIFRISCNFLLFLINSLPSKYCIDEENNLLFLIMERGISSLGDVILEMRK